MCVSVQQEKIKEPGPSQGVRVVSWFLPHFGGVHTSSPEGPAHGTKDRTSSSSRRVADGKSTLAGCPEGYNVSMGTQHALGGLVARGAAVGYSWL